MTAAPTINPRFAGVCECGDHAWAALSRGFVTLVSPQDAPLIRDHVWCVSFKAKAQLAYAERMTKKAEGRSRKVRLHRVLVQGHEHVDHINGVGTDNRRFNLRGCTASQNAANAKKRTDKPTSRFRGVWLDRGRWRAEVRVNGKRHFLGYFLSEEDAAKAYDAASSKHFGSFARSNAALGLYREAGHV